MYQLDKQADGHSLTLLSTLKQYIQTRRTPVLPQRTSLLKDGGIIDEHDPIRSFITPSSKESVLSGPGSTPTDQRPFHSREILTQVVCLSDELLQACQEKANLAQTVHDSVERHIRLLDQAIQEQEAAIFAGQQPDGNILPMLLPDLAVPRWSRTARVTMSPISDGEGVISYNSIDQESDKDEPAGISVKARPKRKRRPDVKEASNDTKLMITIPAQPDAAIDPNEEVYCICNRVSFGEMIACDSPHCRREWFHLGCVGLTESPKGKWFCEECRSTRKTRGNRSLVP
ncbi:hypothetical protein BDQ17DRAFT_1357860 [Cyathus striatus]|nr:hypothetical protein BDQ17DRAFT_1357860 [Cyathus striatus]